MKFLTVLAIILLCCATVSAEIYHWVDEEGKRHFSDRQIEDAKPLDFFDSQHQPINGEKPDRSHAAVKKTAYRPAKKSISADDYDISVRAAQLKDRVILSGRISEGPPCKKFKLDFTLQDKDGHLIHLITVAKDIGGFLSALLNASKQVKYGDTDSEWEIIATNGVCQK